jgi:hypothetical protein
MLLPLKIYHIYAPIARLFVICEKSLKKSRWFSPLFGGKNGTQLLSAHCPQQQDETAVHRSGCRYGSGLEETSSRNVFHNY